jgi:hypothetical protein
VLEEEVAHEYEEKEQRDGRNRKRQRIGTCLELN